MKVLGLARSAFRQVHVQSRKAHDHHAPFNPGPPITWDYSPVPCQKYKNVYSDLQTKFNTYLAIAAALFTFSFSLAIYDDVFASSAITPPKSWKNGEPVLVTS